MKEAYPVILTQGSKYIVVFIPDFNINTQGKDFAEAIEMARDAIGLKGIDFEDDQKEFPTMSSYEEALQLAKKEADEDMDYSTGVHTLVDVDFDAYRRKYSMKSVKKNCTIPYWLSVEAEKADINYSKLLQEAIMSKLSISR